MAVSRCGGGSSSNKPLAQRLDRNLVNVEANLCLLCLLVCGPKTSFTIGFPQIIVARPILKAE